MGLDALHDSPEKFPEKGRRVGEAKESGGRRVSHARAGASADTREKEKTRQEPARPSKEKPPDCSDIDSEILGGLRTKFHHSRSSVSIPSRPLCPAVGAD